MTRFSKSSGINTCLRKPPITTSCASTSRHGEKTASRNASGDAHWDRVTTRVSIPADRAISRPRAEGLLQTTIRMATANWPEVAQRIRFSSVVPPPEIRTAIGNRSLPASGSVGRVELAGLVARVRSPSGPGWPAWNRDASFIWTGTPLTSDWCRTRWAQALVTNSCDVASPNWISVASDAARFLPASCTSHARATASVSFMIFSRCSSIAFWTSAAIPSSVT